MRYLHRTTKRLLAAIVARSGRRLGIPATGSVLLLVLLIVPGLVMTVSAADPLLPVFGEGSVEVRVYTDYFCKPCRAEEGEVMAAIVELVAKNRIRVIFIDTPVHPETVLYSGYFLAAVNAKREFGQAVKARAALFEAAGLKIKGKDKLEGFLALKGLQIRTFDTAPVFAIFSKYIKEDRIKATPTVVIVDSEGKHIPDNKEQTLKALRGLRKTLKS